MEDHSVRLDQLCLAMARKEFKRDTAAVLTQRYGNFKDECFPRPSGGCNCNVKDSSGVQRVKSFNTDAECKVPIEGQFVTNRVDNLLETALKKQEVNEQIKQKFGNLKENCFPKPSGGCKCNEMDSNGNEVVRSYDSEADCNLPLPMSIAGNRKRYQTKRITKRVFRCSKNVLLNRCLWFSVFAK
ncbi:unnamed protein product [Toxocara canis]|uniref:Uncharacterized protein n=1 Tax=Toxocara canis TaxID=6265 RepID=A0A183U1Q2_TOXCA|nr:unnamed protein product [Toxocara canis]